MSLQVGAPAPCFDCEALVDGEFKQVKLGDYKGKWVLLYFYPLDFTFVCPTEIVAFNNAVEDFAARNCCVLAASTDSVFSHLGWTTSHPELRNMRHPMLGDTSHALSKAYGVLLEEKGITLRGTFLIDPDGVLQWASINPLNVGRSVGETLRVLDALQTGGLTPCEWKAGQETLKV
ncbi:MAG: peroxiredoxin [Fimbriimonadaceae bacterium]|nr:peroxiredoxin [Fimbriimonadaceae bacterium]